jgi:hypothetical protein
MAREPSYSHFVKCLALTLRREESYVLYSVLLHLLAGIIAGTVFTVGVLIVSLAFAVFEVLTLALTYGPRAAFSAVLGGVALQIGYLAGIFGRNIYERAGISWRAFRMRRIRPDI